MCLARAGKCASIAAYARPVGARRVGSGAGKAQVAWTEAEQQSLITLSLTEFADGFLPARSALGFV